MLRLVNPHGTDNDVTIDAIDSQGEQGQSPVTLSIPPHAAVQLTSIDLEEGSELTTGTLGDGAGKWRLTVEGSHYLYTLSLLRSPVTGHITNLSR